MTEEKNEKESRIVRVFKEFEICFNCKQYELCLSSKNIRPYNTCEQFEFKSKQASK